MIDEVSSSTDLAMRRVPRREHGKATVNLILVACGEILEEYGFHGLTTNRVAERSGVNIASIYRYFPNKFSIINELSGLYRGERMDFVSDKFVELVSTPDWRKTLDELIESIFIIREKQGGLVGIRKAIQVSAELQSVELNANREIAIMLHKALFDRRPDKNERALFVTSIWATEMIISIFDLVYESNDVTRDELIAELKLATILRFAEFLD